MRKLLIMIATLLLATDVLAQKNSNTDLVLYGVATRSCGQFLKSQELQNEDYGFYVSWLQGYLSAVNLHAIHGRQDIGAKTDIQSMMLWLKNHCANNPLDQFGLSVISLTAELK